MKVCVFVSFCFSLKYVVIVGIWALHVKRVSLTPGDKHLIKICESTFSSFSLATHVNSQLVQPPTSWGFNPVVLFTSFVSELFEWSAWKLAGYKLSAFHYKQNFNL